MLQLGDYVEDYTKVNFSFTTIADATLVPTVLAGSPIISVYKGSATGTEKTSAEAYITLDIDFDSKVGLNHVLINLATDAFFVAGEDYFVVITTGTVGGASRIGMIVAHFSIENRFMRGTDSGALASVATESRLAELDAANLPTTTDDIKTGVVTNAAGIDVATDIIALKTVADNIETDTGEIGTAGASLSDLGGMSTAMKAEVNVEAKDVLNVDTYTEPGQEAPGVSVTLEKKISYIYKFLRNKVTQSSTETKVFADNESTVDQKATVSDDDTIATRGEFGTGA